MCRPNASAYASSKLGLVGLTRSSAIDLAPYGVLVNAVSPGPIKTLSAAGIRDFREMLKVAEGRSPLGRNVSAADVAELTALLAGDGGAGITGQVLKVDAGLSILGI